MSQLPDAPDLPHTWRPVGPRIVALVLGVGLVVIVSTAWLTFDPEVQAKFTAIQLVTVVGMVGVGLLLLHALTRSRVTADRSGLVVVNGFKRHEYEWAEIVSVNLPPGAPWVTLDLADGRTVSALGIQGSDGDRAHRAVRQLRVLVDELPR